MKRKKNFYNLAQRSNREGGEMIMIVRGFIHIIIITLQMMTIREGVVVRVEATAEAVTTTRTRTRREKRKNRTHRRRRQRAFIDLLIIMMMISMNEDDVLHQNRRR